MLRCTTRLVSGSFKIVLDGDDSVAQLTHAGVVYAQGTVNHGRLRLRARRALRAGVYTLIVRFRRGRRVIVLRTRIRVV